MPSIGVASTPSVEAPNKNGLLLNLKANPAAATARILKLISVRYHSKGHTSGNMALALRHYTKI